jgi:hypothetical protein
MMASDFGSFVARPMIDDQYLVARTQRIQGPADPVPVIGRVDHGSDLRHRSD